MKPEDETEKLFNNQVSLAMSVSLLYRQGDNGGWILGSAVSPIPYYGAGSLLAQFSWVWMLQTWAAGSSSTSCSWYSDYPVKSDLYVIMLVQILQRNRTIKIFVSLSLFLSLSLYVCVCMYYKELIMEIKKSQDRQGELASWRPGWLMYSCRPKVSRLETRENQFRCESTKGGKKQHELLGNQAGNSVFLKGEVEVSVFLFYLGLQLIG